MYIPERLEVKPLLNSHQPRIGVLSRLICLLMTAYILFLFWVSNSKNIVCIIILYYSVDKLDLRLFLLYEVKKKIFSQQRKEVSVLRLI